MCVCEHLAHGQVEHGAERPALDEPVTSRLQVRCPNHYATMAHYCPPLGLTKYFTPSLSPSHHVRR